jgi:nucleotide-binding universal stress UspA family protein
MKRILVALDLSPSSEWAFERAVQLAGADEASLDAVHVIDDQLLRYGDQTEEFGASLAARAEAKLSRLWSDLPASLRPRFRHAIRTGMPSQGIVAAAAEYGADLIVLGMHRAGAMKDLFVGTTAERIIRQSDAPVLMVRDNPDGPYRKVLVATDLSEASSRALQAALRLVPGADFLVGHVFETPFPGLIRMTEEHAEDYRKQRAAETDALVRRDLAAFLAVHTGPKKPTITSLCERGEAIGGLAAMVERHQPELLVIGTNGSDGGAGSRLGSVAVAFLNNPPCDVLVSH